ncbi:triadin-like [Branchiostoma lanceolatum]|uniref:triadin-like n=1 Tax=Branchiostoma lanceolatum TaxID=7740 RepID=UPI003453F81D
MSLTWMKTDGKTVQTKDTTKETESKDKKKKKEKDTDNDGKETEIQKKKKKQKEEAESKAKEAETQKKKKKEKDADNDGKEKKPGIREAEAEKKKKKEKDADNDDKEKKPGFGDKMKGFVSSLTSKPSVETEEEVAKKMKKTSVSDLGPVQVFLSYQWDHQKQVIQLREMLEEKGYSCWMDIKEMGGGDKLYAAIDKGMRQTKVVISCVTPKYTKSANCRNEVALAYNLKKPIVPVLLEKTSWPPKGPMAMPFAQLLYIDFTKESKKNPWQGPHFDELMASVVQTLKG